MPLPKNQHWVPQFYLRYFATPETRDGDNPQVAIFSKNPADGDEVVTNIRNICAKRYLYAPTTGTGVRTWDVEHRLQDLEAHLARVWPALADDFVDLSDTGIRQGLALFIGALVARHPDVLHKSEETHRQIVPVCEAAPRRSDGTPDVDELEISGRLVQVDTAGWNAYRAWRSEDHHRFFVETLQEQAGHLANLLFQKRWSMLIAEQDTFVTSDKPVALQHLDEGVFGVGTRGVIVTFPVSPTRLLVLDDKHEEPANQYYRLRPRAGAAANLLICRGGSRFVITGRPIQAVLQEVVDAATDLSLPCTAYDC